MPKFACWKIWIARDNAIFHYKPCTPLQTASQAKGLMIECLNSSKHRSDVTLSNVEWRWIGVTPPHPSTEPLQRLQPTWHIKLSNLDFQEWRNNQDMDSLHFDEASKNNPDAARARGVFWTREGTMRLKYSWGLGTCSNNIVEALALMKGCQLAKEHKIDNLQVFRDSMIIIRALNTNTTPNNLPLSRIIQRIRQISSTFTNFKAYHLLRSLNNEADIEANGATSLSQGNLKLSDTVIEAHHIP